MAAFHPMRLARGAVLLFSIVVATCWSARGAEVVFDVPGTIECRDATPPEFAALHPELKVIEGKLRISARVAKGTESEIVDFLYTIANPTRSMRFQDYLPNTMLESAVADDQIEITDNTESASGGNATAQVVYKPFTFGANLNQASKQCETSSYKQIAPKELVLASGTTDREHGVFFRLRPSRAASLEGAKEFAFLATVPKSWRGDVCTIACAARTERSSLFSPSIGPAGQVDAQVGLCLVGDAEAAALCQELRLAQESLAAAQAAHPAKHSTFSTISSEAVGFLTSKKRAKETERALEEAEAELSDVLDRLTTLAH